MVSPFIVRLRMNLTSRFLGLVDTGSLLQLKSNRSLLGFKVLDQCFFYFGKHAPGELHSCRHYSSKVVVRSCSLSKDSRQCLGLPNVSKPLQALFFGTDEFSLESLKLLFNDLTNGDGVLKRLDVVCSTKVCAVRHFATEKQLKLYEWPPQIPDVLRCFSGILNVHASLLPRWRGAAPIIYSILSGDLETGISIMRIEPKRFDEGNILCQARCSIMPLETRPELTLKLAKMGSQLLLETIGELPQRLKTARPQSKNGVTYAPRVTSHLSLVNWCQMNAVQVANLSRALDGLYPLSTTWHGVPVKLYNATISTSASDVVTDMRGDVKQTGDKQHVCNKVPGFVEYHKLSGQLRVLCQDQKWVYFKCIGVPGKKRMKPVDFYNGYLSKHDHIERIFDVDRK